MAQNYSVPDAGYRQLELCFGPERNSELEEAIRNSTIPDFLREAKPFLDYPHPQKVPEILFDYFPGQFGRKQELDPSNLLRLRTIVKGVYGTYSAWMGFLNGAVPYSLEDGYLRENADEKAELMKKHLGKRIQTQIARLASSPDHDTKIGELFREQVWHYQKEILKGNRKKR